MNTHLKIFAQFFRRDLRVYKTHALQLFINSSLIIPFLFTLTFGITLPLVGTGTPNPMLATTMLLGSALWAFYQVPGKMCMEIFYDMIEPQFIVYQTSILTHQLVLLEKALFISIITFFHMIPFFLIAKLLMGSLLILSSTLWPQLFLMIYFSGLFIATFMLFMICFINNRFKLRNFMIRFTVPLIQFAGYFGTTWYTMKQFSPLFAKILLLDPFIYISEGLRSTVLQDPHSLHYSLCIPLLIVYSAGFFYLSCIYFKKKMDLI